VARKAKGSRGKGSSGCPEGRMDSKAHVRGSLQIWRVEIIFSTM